MRLSREMNQQKFYLHAVDTTPSALSNVSHQLSFNAAPLLRRISSEKVKIRLHEVSLVGKFNEPQGGTTPCVGSGNIMLESMPVTNMITHSSNYGTTLLHMVNIKCNKTGSEHYFSYKYVDTGSGMELVYDKNQLPYNGLITANIIDGKNFGNALTDPYVQRFDMTLEISGVEK